MQKNIGLSLLFIIALMLSSCDKATLEDVDTVIERLTIGEWHTNTQCSSAFTAFRKDNEYYDSNGDTGTWELSEDAQILTIRVGTGINGTGIKIWTILGITNDEIVVEIKEIAVKLYNIECE